MTVFDGFTVTSTVFSSNTTTIYRAIRQSDGQSVILKCTAEYPSSVDVYKLQREYGVLANLKDVGGVVQAFQFVDRTNTDAHIAYLVLEELADGASESQPLNTVLPLDLDSFLDVAIQLADTLEKVHKHYILHKVCLLTYGTVYFAPYL